MVAGGRESCSSINRLKILMESDGGKRGERRLVIRENSDAPLRVYAITLGDVGVPALQIKTN
jgi:hypothetical protein